MKKINEKNKYISQTNFEPVTIFTVTIFFFSKDGEISNSGIFQVYDLVM